MCMYTILAPRRVASFFETFSPFTHTILYRYRLINRSTGSGSNLGTEASRTSPGISIRRTVISRGSHTLYLELRQCPALPVRLRSRESNPRHAPKSFWSPHQGAGPFLLDLQVLGGFRTTRNQKNRAAWLAVWHSTHCATALLSCKF